jgi:drug/metabolite transporter (DMT)-like permease
MNASGASAGLGLVSAATWGGSDFVGGMGARRSPALLVVASGHVVSLLLLAAICLSAHIPLPGRHELLLAGVAGLEGSLSLVLFYRALSLGAMGLTAALTGLLTALIPVLYSLATEGMPGRLTLAGLALGLVAIWLITHTPAENGPASPPAALLLGALAGTGFGTQLIFFKMASSGGVFWNMTSARFAGTVGLLLVILVKPPRGAGRAFWQFGIPSGLLDTVGTLVYLRAVEFGRLDVAAVVCSLYPAGTILLAALVLHERPSRRQLAGVAVALGAVMLLSA